MTEVVIHRSIKYTSIPHPYNLMANTTVSVLRKFSR